MQESLCAHFFQNSQSFQVLSSFLHVSIDILPLCRLNVINYENVMRSRVVRSQCLGWMHDTETGTEVRLFRLEESERANTESR